jgi:hypothetical protein
LKNRAISTDASMAEPREEDQSGVVRNKSEVGEEEKEHDLTGSSRACSERSEEGQSGRISPESREEEEDAPVAAVSFGSIP